MACVCVCVCTDHDELPLVHFVEYLSIRTLLITLTIISDLGLRTFSMF